MKTLDDLNQELFGEKLQLEIKQPVKVFVQNKYEVNENFLPQGKKPGEEKPLYTFFLLENGKEKRFITTSFGAIKFLVSNRNKDVIIERTGKTGKDYYNFSSASDSFGDDFLK